MEKKIRLGVFGAGRGNYLGSVAGRVGFQVVAVCDGFKPLLDAAQRWNSDKTVTYYTDYEKFLEHDMEAVIVANYATEHAAAAIRALDSGKHVMSECMAIFTMSEGVALAEAVERSRKVYLFAENYPFFTQNQEMARLYRSGEMGKFLYGEAEYIHPADARCSASLCSGLDHWRSWAPVTYYCTHSMGPLMLITGLRPKSVTGFVVPHDFDDPQHAGKLKRGDAMSVLMCKMENDGLAKIVPCTGLRDHGQRVRICCNRGSMEYNQGDSRLRLRKEAMDWPAGTPVNTFYEPRFPSGHEEAERYGHGGADYFTSYYFAKAIREESNPVIDVYMAIDMTAIGILGYRSALEGGIPQVVPDFRDRKIRAKYKSDDWNPDPKRRKPGMPYSSVLGDIKISPKDLALFKKYRKEYEKSLS